MKINNSQGNIELVGDIKEFKTSIDPKNLEFITTLLSSNLYSNPEQSFIREIVSNAWDSHVEAGTTDVPVIIKFNRNGSSYNITIRDYGTGLSPKRFNEVYRNIGSSTKRDSNEFIGGFGLGRFSALSCSNSVYITSYYEGIAYYYVMLKSGNSININLLVEKPTSEKNGVEVTLRNITNITPYEKALEYIIFFPNIYVEGSNVDNKINNSKIKKFNNFAATSIDIDSRLLLGNVLYPCNKSLLPVECSAFLNTLGLTGIVIKFEVGEIDITPNRESIIYTSNTIKKITDRIIAAKEELEGIITTKLTKDYDDIVEYNEILSKIIRYEPVSDEFTLYNGYLINPMKVNNAKITYNGIDLRNKVSLGSILSLALPNSKGVILDNKIYTKNTSYNLARRNSLKSENILILNAKARLTEILKLYLKDNYNEYTVITDITYSEFKDWINKDQSVFLLKSSIKDLIIKGIYDSIYKRAKKLDLDTDVDYLKFKNEQTLDKKSNPPIKEVIIYTWKYELRYKNTFKGFSQAVDYIKSLNKGVILENMDAPVNTLSRIANIRGYVLIQARKDVIKYLRELNLKCVIDTEWLLNKDPLISAVKSTLVHFPKRLDISIIREICSNLSKNEIEEIKKVIDLRNTYGGDVYYANVINDADVKCDPYIEHLCIKLKNYIKKYGKVKELANLSGLNSSVLNAAIIVKTKAYRISGEAYQKVRKNKLLKVLCKK